MADVGIKRRLAVVLAADVVGYGRLMQQDEPGTLAALKSRRTGILVPLVARYEGRIFKTTGDGVLIEFASAVHALQCAVEIQAEFAAANGDVPADRQVVLRIGINLGDVMVEGGDLYGDGVNIAARLESLADAGGIYVSRTVYDHVRGKVAFEFEDIGPQSLKNVAEPVGVFRFRRRQAVATPASPEPPNPYRSAVSIAVLPFTNMSGDPEQAYFSDGITEDIITELSRFRGIAVVARHSSFQFDSRGVDVRKLRNELGVGYVLEGSVRRLGDRVRITAQLIDAATGNHLWAERFDRELKDLFSVQDQVVRTIVGTVMGRVQASDTEHARRKPPASMLAYDYVLRGDAMPIGDADAEAEAQRLYRKAIELDPTYGIAHSRLAHNYALEAMRDDRNRVALLDRALESGMNGVRFDETNSECHAELGWLHIMRREFDLAGQCCRRAIELNPNDPESIANMGEWLCFVGRPAEALALYEQVRQVNPHFNPAWWFRTRGVAHFNARQYEASLASFGRSRGDLIWVKGYVAACHAYLGRAAEAAVVADTILKARSGFSSRNLVESEPFKLATDREHFLQGLLRAGLPE